MAISPELLEILVCPKCKGDLELISKGDAVGGSASESRTSAAPQADSDGLVCRACGLLYRIEDDIPIMLIDEAKKI